MKEMKKYISNLIDMFHCLFTLGPALFVVIIATVIIDAALPYINVVAIQLMIDELMISKQSEKIKYIIIITIATNVFFQLASGLLKKKREFEQVKTELLFRKKMNEHEMRLSMSDIESNRVQELIGSRDL